MDPKKDERERSESPEEPPVVIKPIAASKLQAFSIGSSRKTPFQKHKEELELKKKRESEEAAKVYEEFVASFEDAPDFVTGIKSSSRQQTMVARDSELDYERPAPSTFKPTSFVKAGEQFPRTQAFVKAGESSSFKTPAFVKAGETPSSKPPAFTKAGETSHRSNFTSEKKESPKFSVSKPAAKSISLIPKKETGNSIKPMPFVKAGEGTKPMPFVKAGQTTGGKAKMMIDQEESDEEDDALARKEAKSQKKRNLDTFLEEIKKEQEDRDDRLRKVPRSSSSASSSGRDISAGITLKAAFEDRQGSHDLGDPWTTNLYVGNINPAVNEMQLCQEFGRYGPIASVKIMWPRSQEEHDRNRNCGFVSFMERRDAEQALRALDGKDVQGYVMKVGWGKAVPLPAQPMFVLEKAKQPMQTGLPFNAQIVKSPVGTNVVPRAEVKVTKPTNMNRVKIIHRLIERVIKHGPQFEHIIMEREKDNPAFEFLFKHTSPDHIYYRWRLYSILQGDSKSDWRTEPFQMFEGGAWWIPPEVPFNDEGKADMLLDSEDEEQEKGSDVPKGTLGPIARQRLEILLRQVTFKRGTIARAMAFAIDHADAADEVIDLVIKSLLLPETPLSVKLARLYLVSDILHNSSVHVPNAWKYRQSFEPRLPPVFEHLNGIYRSISARLKAEQVRRHISSVLTVWENWMVFPKHFIDELNATFMKKSSDPAPRTDNWQPLTSAGEHSQSTSPLASSEKEEAILLAASSADKEAIASADVADADVDGQPMEEDVDGEPLEEGVDGEPLDDIDGEPMEGDDVDGLPLEEDIDGQPLDDRTEPSDAHAKDGAHLEIQDMFA
ncbi:uncharacterized protein BYT42DRAFT_566518 [Radiomyces spectabilis]|uniref:uncharacterized protein n=1 Tax=Radiomyces spectabilis TaxID=64574 RepID=UPI002220FDEA|nr:uncharacterized protein BYT42DRAFT_566518 [Radiomyces spectabilis]KAI8381439.1 hypothetical protein BYT42DRAFT_566518 [Radiomyces spectabilis]